MTDNFDDLITPEFIKDFGALSGMAQILFGDGTPTVEDQLREEIRLMDEFHNRCFDL